MAAPAFSSIDRSIVGESVDVPEDIRRVALNETSQLADAVGVVADDPFIVEDGAIAVPDDPGLGISVDESKIEQDNVEETAVLTTPLSTRPSNRRRKCCTLLVHRSRPF